MFVTPGARPPRRTPPTWSFVTGAVMVVIVVLVAVLVTRNDGEGARRLEVANERADQVAREMATLDASLLSIADLGSGWQTARHGGLNRDDLRWTDECDHAPGLESTAQAGRYVDFSYALDPRTGAEAGHVQMTVRQYASSDDASGQYAARADAAFGSCVRLFDVTDLVDAQGSDIVPGALTRVAIPGVDAVVYRDVLDYTFFGKRQTLYVTTAYLTHGRDLAVLSIDRCCQDYDPLLVAELVRTVSQRLAIHAPE
jgi:hypothetical protein